VFKTNATSFIFDESNGGNIIFSQSNTAKLTLDTSGNLGLGVTPSAWNLSGLQALQIKNASLSGYLNNSYLSANTYYSGGWNYIATAVASQYVQTNGQHQFFNAASGTAGTAITFTQAMTLDANSNLQLGTTSNLGNSSKLSVQVDGTYGAVAFARNTDNSFPVATDYYKSRGSAASPTAVQNGDGVYQLRSVPYQGSAYTYLLSMAVEIDGTFTSGQNPPTRILWHTNAANGSATERARIPSTGGIQSVNSISVGNATPSTSGAGITFPATQSASTDANTLDDYEEGTWTPTVIGSTTAGTATYSVQNGRYTKIGRLVQFEMYCSWGSGTGTGNLKFAGLPFTSANSLTYPAVCISYPQNIALTSLNVAVANISNNATTIEIQQYPVGGGGVTAVAYDIFAELILTGSYTV
jgi:hypothetical protein